MIVLIQEIWEKYSGLTNTKEKAKGKTCGHNFSYHRFPWQLSQQTKINED